MSSETNITAFALQDILEGIADGLSEAQRNLRDIAPYDAYGRPNTIYQVPYLEFSLQVTSEFQTVTDENQQKRSVLKFQPAKQTSTTESKTEIFSSVTGKFIATVPNEGLPQINIQIKSDEPTKKYSYYEINLEVAVSNSVGEKTINATVEFNFDETTSNALSASAIANIPVFTIAEVSTDGDGIAKTMVKLNAVEFDAGKFFVIKVNLGTITKSISLSKF